jgi:hypothetical protein
MEFDAEILQFIETMIKKIIKKFQSILIFNANVKEVI